jgi:hypothetical protein
MEPLGTVEKPYHVLTLILSPELNVAGGETQELFFIDLIALRRQSKKKRGRSFTKWRYRSKW